MSLKHLLEVEIEDQFDKLAAMEKGSDEYKAMVESTIKLTDRMIELEKLEDERLDKEQDRDFDHELKLNESKENKRDRIIKNGISIAGIILPIVLTVWGTKTSLKFEEEGTITTTVGRGFINKLLPKK